MRYDTPLFFVKETKKQYDPDSGEWSSGELAKEKRWANVTDLSAERQKVLFGDVRPNRFVVRLQRVYTKDYDYIEINGKTYIVDKERCPSDKQSLVVIGNG